MKSTANPNFNRIIGTFRGVAPGPLLLVFGAIHGNEPAGPEAIRAVFQLLEKEKIANPEFIFFGKMTGLIGNLQAFSGKKRFLKKDLNRAWTEEKINEVLATDLHHLTEEKREIRQLLEAIRAEIMAEQPTEIVLFDLHTTSAEGGVFIIPGDDLDSLELAAALKAPVVKGLLDGVSGTILQFFSKENLIKFGGWQPKIDHPIAPHLELKSCAFEAGHHDDHESVSRSVAAIVHCLRAIGCIEKSALENPHEAVLAEFSEKLPGISQLDYVHKIAPGDDFEMDPGFQNFQKIKKGERLAADKNGEILAPTDGHILMPLYQKQGSDGFFIVKTD